MRRSRRAIRSSKAAPRFELPALVLALALLSALAVGFFFKNGWLLWYGDAEAHLNTARRILDSRTPGYAQLGTPWLPLLHVLLIPFVRVDRLWWSGLAASFPAAFFFVMGGAFLFAAARRVFASSAAGFAAAGLAALNPNLLYLQSTAMTEAVFFGCMMALLYFTVSGRAAAAGLAAFAAALTRYEGWWLLPFVAGYCAVRREWRRAVVFSVIAGLAPLYWMGHNWFFTGDPLDFYRGPYSPIAIQGSATYPGRGDWRTAWLYYRTAARLCAGPGLAAIGCIGAVAALVRRAFWPMFLLALPPAFVLWSMHRGVVPIFAPELWPHAYYNTRYGLHALPLLAFSAAALAAAAPARFRKGAAALLIAIGAVYWVAYPRPQSWITWAESKANSEGRRAWTNRAAQVLSYRYHAGAGILASGGDDFYGIFREAHIPLRETFSVTNGISFLAAAARPDLFLHERWAVVKGGDLAQSAVLRAGRYGIDYVLLERLIEKSEPVVEIYQRRGGMHGPP